VKFYFDIDDSDVPIKAEAFKFAGGKLELQDETSSTSACQQLPSLFLPNGTYFVRVSSTEFKRGGYVFSTRLHWNIRIPKFQKTLKGLKLRPTPGGIEYFELLGGSVGNIFTPPSTVKGVQLLGQGFHAQILDLAGNVLHEGLPIAGLARAKPRAGEATTGEELSFEGLSSGEQYVLGVFRTDMPTDLSEDEISRLPVIPYSVLVLSDAVPDQTPPKAELVVNTSTVLYPQTVTITAEASDDVRVDGVAFYEDGQLVSMDTQTPYILEMTYSMLRNGSHTYSVKIYDSAGNVASGFNTVKVSVDISNMILNPGAEIGFGESDATPPVESVPAFTPMNGFTVVRYGSPNGFPSLDTAAQIAGESNFFAGGTASVSSATQLLNIADGASQIDAGLSYDFSGFLGGFEDQRDYAAVSVEFRDGSGNVLGNASLPGVDVAARNGQTMLLPRNATGTVPVGTRYIFLTITMTKVESDPRNDALVDNLRLSLFKP
jgi:hypothetical protein